MSVNADKPERWKKDIAASVDFFNKWFMAFAPGTYRAARTRTIDRVKEALEWTDDLRSLSPEVLRDRPAILQTLRMATAPPIARDRLISLSQVNAGLVHTMAKRNRVPPRMESPNLVAELRRITDVLRALADADLFPWLESRRGPTVAERTRAATVVADRLTGALADPIVRNAQEQRQSDAAGTFLRSRGYTPLDADARAAFTDIPGGKYAFHLNVPVRSERGKQVIIPVDLVVRPHRSKERYPLLIEAKSAGDFTNVNKRRKEEATKISQLRRTYGKSIRLVLLLCGYFDTGYLGYEAAEGLDWVWEHRLEDLTAFGI
ncbi:MAG: XamI family restriction endonuclease [Phycisphaerae bacterium]